MPYPDRFYPVVDTVEWVRRLTALGVGTVQLRAKDLDDASAMILFRAALDVHACCINSHMLVAAVRALARLAREPVPEEVLRAYKLKALAFGRGYIIPKPLDPRLLKVVPAAVAQAAVDTGVARARYPAHYPPP